jgi:hypothetical protein
VLSDRSSELAIDMRNPTNVMLAAILSIVNVVDASPLPA